MKVYVVVNGLHDRFVDVKKTDKEANKLINELIADNASVGVKEVKYRVIEKEL